MYKKRKLVCSGGNIFVVVSIFWVSLWFLSVIVWKCLFFAFIVAFIDIRFGVFHKVVDQNWPGTYGKKRKAKEINFYSTLEVLHPIWRFYSKIRNFSKAKSYTKNAYFQTYEFKVTTKKTLTISPRGIKNYSMLIIYFASFCSNFSMNELLV